ncbi:MAG: metallophosphoesterase family protein [Myxococcota bacterium]
MYRLAHLSDLHLGERPEHEAAARDLVRAVREERVDHVVVTGDVTHAGLVTEYERWLEIFQPLLDEKRVTVVPGNHDRAGDGVAELLSDELRVSVDGREGLFLICIDSTAPHNRATFRSHGELCEQMLHAVDLALTRAPEGWTRAVLLHHHVLPMPVEGLGEWFAEQFGWPHAAELPLGRELLRRVQGRVDLVLHGHKHVPRETVLDGPRPLRVANAGCSTALGAFRVFEHAHGVVRPGRWIRAGPVAPPPLLARLLHGDPSAAFA